MTEAKDDIDLMAYGNREARMRHYQPKKGPSLYQTKLEFRSRLVRNQKKIDKCRKIEEETLISSLVEKLRPLSNADRLSFLLSLPKSTPFAKLPKKLLPSVWLRMRASWFDEKK